MTEVKSDLADYPGSLRKEVLRSIQPSPAMVRAEQRWARQMVSRLQHYAPAGSRVVVAGSIAKGTFLQNDKDIDIFLLVSPAVPRSKLENIVAALVRRTFPRAPREIKYAEHPYVRLRVEGRRIDVVPAYVIRDASERISAVDRSVLHTRCIRSRLPRSLVPDVLLLKKFLKSAGLYGAEIRVQGASGYLCELLVLHFKGFERCLKAASRWRPPVFIDLNKANKGQFHASSMRVEMMEMMKRFPAPLVVVDPTDPNRNVAAAVSQESFTRFIRLSRRFCSQPSPRFFEPSPSFGNKLLKFRRKSRKSKKAKGAAYLASLCHGPVVDDILWGQLRKLAGQLQVFLEAHGFGVAGVLLDTNDRHAHLAVRLRSPIVPSYHWVAGPSLDLKKHVAAFQKAHRNARFRRHNGRLWVELRRPFVTGRAALRAFFESVTLPSHLEKKGMRIQSL